MQSIVWMGLAVTAGMSVTGAALIVRGARAKMKARRRQQQINRWVREEIAGKEQMRPRTSPRLFVS